jgi:hypothetical protein
MDSRMIRSSARVLIGVVVAVAALGWGAIPSPYRLAGADTAATIDIAALFHDGHDRPMTLHLGATSTAILVPST